MGGLTRESACIKNLSVQRAADGTDPLILHGHPLELLDADLVMELDPALVVGPQHLGACDHLHSVLGLAEHLGTRVPKRFRVLHDTSKIANDIFDAFAGGDAVHYGPLDSISQFAVNVSGKHQVVVGHEIESVGVDKGEHAGGKFIDAFGSQVTIKR